MKAIIFCAGLGTRFKPWTDKHPKALALVHGKSLLQRNIEYLQRYSIYEVVVNVHHFADQIEDAIKVNNGWGSSVIISDERNEVLETGGGLLKAASLLGGEKFLAINVDILTDLDISKMIASHDKHGALATLGVSDRRTSRYFLFNEMLQLCGWRNIKTGEEKISRSDQATQQLAFSGVHIIEGRLLNMISQRGKFSIVDVYLDLSVNNKIIGFDHTGAKLIDVGKPEAVAEAELMFS
ncbi:MAG: nucleotidyltransferase family protein [Chitinophagaceae bacterium]|nr:MAG: nucleotidyltransferase family protein [Chitinophagaceae bacterium]